MRRRAPGNRLETASARAPSLWLFAGVVVLAGYLALTRSQLVREGLWRDDAISVAIARAPTSSEFFRRLSYLDSQPPLYPASLALWGHLFGWSETSLKTEALLGAAAAFAGVALVAWGLAGPWAGLLAALFAANHPLLLTLASDVRPYAGSIAAATLSLFLVFATEKMRTGARAAMLAAVFLLLVYWQYTGTLVGAVIGLFALAGSLTKTRRAHWASVLAASALAGLAFVPWIPAFLRHLRIGLPWDPRLSLGDRLLRVPGRAVEAFPWLSSRGGLAASVGGLLVVLSALLASRRLADAVSSLRLPLALYGAAALAVFLAMSLFADPLRYLTIPAALGCVLLAVALAEVLRATRGGSLAWLARLGALGVVAGSFLVPRDSLRSLSAAEAAGVPKSGARSMCRDAAAGGRDLYLVVPDFVASSVRYYCGDGIRLRGFPQWESPELPRWDVYLSEWRSPALPVRARIADAIRREGFERVRIVTLVESGALEAIPLIRERLAELRAVLPDRGAPERSYPGRLESLRVREISSRAFLEPDLAPSIIPRR